jgi:hypothetical protein
MYVRLIGAFGCAHLKQKNTYLLTIEFAIQNNDLAAAETPSLKFLT